LLRALLHRALERAVDSNPRRDPTQACGPVRCPISAIAALNQVLVLRCSQQTMPSDGNPVEAQHKIKEQS
jgi:hypothetical protein